ncbi:MAG: hypothetical protein KDC92_10340 [Bacteroidetes bacterium]|nr:hypothetical protein [Bacteroidota bacterium]
MHTKLYSVSEGEFEKLAKKALKYALISAPFTVNRMAIDDLPKRIENIVKGKLAELMVGAFLISRNVEVDFERCQTPFYQTDKHDFIYCDYEWDIKNNYLNIGSKSLKDNDFSSLPALIPNRFRGDQWSKRDRTYHNTKGLRMLFTFMIRQKKVDKKKKNLFDMQIETEQLEFLSALVDKHGGKNYEKAPFEEKWFWHEWQH